VIAAGQRSGNTDGLLEHKIMDVLGNWSDHEEAGQSPDGAEVHYLIHALYPWDVDDPACWIIDLVLWDAATWGWGTHSGIIKQRPRPTSDHVVQQQKLVMGLYAQLEQASPQFSRELDCQIEQGIWSRQIPPQND